MVTPGLSGASLVVAFSPRTGIEVLQEGLKAWKPQKRKVAAIINRSAQHIFNKTSTKKRTSNVLLP